MKLDLDRAMSDDLAAELAALIPVDAPPVAGLGWISDWLKITSPAVLAAVKSGRIPALEIPGAKGTVAAYAVRPTDAVRLWGPQFLRRQRAALESA